MIDEEKLKEWEENSALMNEETRKILEQTYWLSAEKAVMEEIERELSLKRSEQQAIFDKFIDETQELGI